MNTSPNVILYGDVSLNIIDGSSIWLTAMTEVLSRAGASVRVVLKSPVENERLVGPLRALSNVELVEPSEHLTPRTAAHALVRADAAYRADILIVRGLRACAQVAANSNLASKLWAYVTDLPVQPRNAEGRALLERIARAAHVMFAQTEDARAVLEHIAPASAGKTLLLPPMIPDPPSEADGTAPERIFGAVYSGKMARFWNTLELLELPRSYSEAYGARLPVVVIGDKINCDTSDPRWSERMAEALQNPPEDVSVLGAMPRADSISEMRKYAFGYSWRHESMNGSHEISTKVLEYASVGVLPIVNDTAAHRALLGDDYPLLVTSQEEIIAALRTLEGDPRMRETLSARVVEAVTPYFISSASDRLRQYMERYAPRNHDVDEPVRVVVAGHDFKFAADLFDALKSGPFDVKVDKWDSLRTHDEKVSAKLAEWADLVICEWAGPNAVWYAANKRDGQRLIVRLHGFEQNGPWIRSLDMAAVDRMIFVSEAARAEVLARLDWDKSNTSVVSNTVDTADFQRPKNPDARYHLGILGVVPTLKRLDRAVDLIERLVAVDDRYVLHVRGRAPWDYPWVWDNPAERSFYRRIFERVSAPTLRDNVVFEGFGPDVAGWFRKIGYILSPSSRETFHLATLEGMASGSVPLVWQRPGAGELFGAGALVDSVDEAARRILEDRVGPGFEAGGIAAKEASLRFDMLAGRRQWMHVIESVGVGSR